MLRVSRARAASSPSARGQVVVGVALLTLAVWQPSWVRAAAAWYFGACQALVSWLVNSQPLRAATAWYFTECQALVGPMISSFMRH